MKLTQYLVFARQRPHIFGAAFYQMETDTKKHEN
jgi:hypothetical protein